ncbi:hypothetical protein F5887DRAFT_986662, partial [Amanita rubescens]
SSMQWMGVLTSPGGEAKEALELNAVRSYWMSSRDRNQMVAGRVVGGSWVSRIRMTSLGASSSLKSIP